MKGRLEAHRASLGLPPEEQSENEKSGSDEDEGSDGEQTRSDVGSAKEATDKNSNTKKKQKLWKEVEYDDDEKLVTVTVESL